MKNLYLYQTNIQPKLLEFYNKNAKIVNPLVSAVLVMRVDFLFYTILQWECKCTLKCAYSKTYISGHSKIDKTKALKTNGSLLKVESITESSLGTICNTFITLLKHSAILLTCIKQ